MKKTLVDLTYYSFPDEHPDGIVGKCTSTLGFLEKLSAVFTTHFVVRSEKGFPKISHQSIDIHFHKGKTVRKWQIPFRFSRYIQSLNPDYILVHGFGAAPYLIFLKIMCPRAKILLQCNGFAPRPNGIKKLIYTISNRFIDGYLFTGRENAKHWYDNNTISKNKIVEVMEGSVNFRFHGNEDRKENNFLWVGRLDENKDPLTVVKAFRRFLEHQPNAKLTMVFHEGDLEPQVSHYISNHQLANSIQLKGCVPHTDLEKTYHEHQYFVLGSHYEGSGYALLEAMACGCIPVVTDIPSFQYMTGNGNCGLLFSPKNETELVEQFQKTALLDWNEYQKKVVDNFENNLSFQAIANKIAAAFQS